MLHEILLTLAGNPSRLLAPAPDDGPARAAAARVLSPPERALLAKVAHLGDLHARLASSTAELAAAHPSTTCRAVAAAVDSVHLAAFQRQVLAVEEQVLRGDAGLVGAANAVPLTAVVGEFSGWTRRLEWLWELVEFMTRRGDEQRQQQRPGKGKTTTGTCRGAEVIDRLRGELQSGYVDIEQTALSLVRVAETAWLRQVAAWVLHGRLPSFGAGDFFIQKAEDADQDYVTVPALMPSFVTPSTAATMLFIGRSLNHARVKATMESGPGGLDHLSDQLKELSTLSFPLGSAAFSRAMTAVRLSLSRTTLQRLLPLARVVEILRLFRDFFLLGRGDFAVALTHEADERLRSRWRRADNLAYEKREGLATVVVKEGEVASVLGRAWAAMGSMQGRRADEDEEGLELARELLRLTLTKSKPATPLRLGPASKKDAADSSGSTSSGTIVSTPFRNLLFSVPVVLTLHVPSPLDMFLTAGEVHVYTAVNAYLLSIRRAHIRLTDLWKITPLRRHHPAPPGPPLGSSTTRGGGRARVVLLRERDARRSSAMRGAWVTCSAAVFFLAETEAYLQTEVVAGLWDGFHAWLVAGSGAADTEQPNRGGGPWPSPPGSTTDDEEEDIWLAEARSSTQQADSKSQKQQHDPQTIATAHTRFLAALTRRLLLTQESFTEALYELLVQVDHLVALIHRLHAVWTARDLEADAGVVDAFVDLAREEADVAAQMRDVQTRVRTGIESVVVALRALEGDAAFMAQMEDGLGLGGASGLEDEAAFGDEAGGGYVPRRVGGIDRLLMKLDFGVWFRRGKGGGHEHDEYGLDGY